MIFKLFVDSSETFPQNVLTLLFNSHITIPLHSLVHMTIFNYFQHNNKIEKQFFVIIFKELKQQKIKDAISRFLQVFQVIFDNMDGM